MNKNKIGLIFGVFLAAIHAVWSIAIAITRDGMQTMVDWVFNLHSISMDITILPINWANALILVILTFAAGYVLGWIYSAFYNLIAKK